MIKITLGIALAIDCSNVVITIVLLGDLGTKIAAARDSPRARDHELAANWNSNCTIAAVAAKLSGGHD
jgi:hypothetical protein